MFTLTSYFALVFCVKANLHWGVARSSRARFFVCFAASGNSALVHASAPQLLGAIKQTETRARLLLSVDWPLPQRATSQNLQPWAWIQHHTKHAFSCRTLCKAFTPQFQTVAQPALPMHLCPQTRSP